MTRRNYAIDEANALLPHLAPALTELQDKFPKAVEIRRQIDAGALTNGGASKRDEWNKLLARVDELFERLASWDVEVRSIEDGLVDLPAVIDGGEAYLCWRLGEPRVAFWHRPDEGFAGRKPL